MKNLLISPVINKIDHMWLDKPFIKLEIDHYASHGVKQGETPGPETLIGILQLMEDES